MNLKATAAIVVLCGTACAGSTQHPGPIEDEFMMGFEGIQTPSYGGSGVMLLSATSEDGKVTIFGSSVEPLDRLARIWGSDGPAVPLWFSPQAGAYFSIMKMRWQKELGLSSADADEYAWNKIHELRQSRKRP